MKKHGKQALCTCVGCKNRFAAKNLLYFGPTQGYCPACSRGQTTCINCGGKFRIANNLEEMAETWDGDGPVCSICYAHPSWEVCYGCLCIVPEAQAVRVSKNHDRTIYLLCPKCAPMEHASGC